MGVFVTIITTVGVASIIGGLIYIGRKLQILDDLKATSSKIKANLTVITNFIVQNNKNFNTAELHALSPLALTDEGRGFIEKIGFDKAFADHKAEFYQCIDAEQPKLRYDVETAAIKAVSLLSSKEYMGFLKVFFYNNPARNLENTAPTLGVYVRDEYLKEHPEIAQ